MSRNGFFEQILFRVPYVSVHTLDQQHLLLLGVFLRCTDHVARIKTESVYIVKNLLVR